MATEREWVESVLHALQQRLVAESEECHITIASGKKLTYAFEIRHYDVNDEPDPSRPRQYETDLLIYDKRKNGEWTPRVVVECKKGAVTTHDALTYSTKAATHKHVHPYLRYGVLIGDFGAALPGRLIRHGAYFDFMMVWGGDEPTEEELSRFVKVLRDEIEASRTLQELLSGTKSKKKYSLLHRPIILEE